MIVPRFPLGYRGRRITSGEDLRRLRIPPRTRWSICLSDQERHAILIGLHIVARMERVLDAVRRRTS